MSRGGRCASGVGFLNADFWLSDERDKRNAPRNLKIRVSIYRTIDDDLLD